MTDIQELATSQANEQNQSAESLLDKILEHSKIDRSDEAYEIASDGVKEFLAKLLRSDKKEERVRKSLVDEMIAGVDEQLSEGLDEVLHQQDFQQLESAWQGLSYLVKNTDFRENNKICIFNSSKQDLKNDFQDADELFETALYKKVYEQEFGQLGGEPYSALITNYEFGYAAPDIKLMKNLAAIGEVSHAPVVGSASPKFFGSDDIEQLAKLNDLETALEGPQYAKWHSFRETEAARYFALTTPKFLLRLPYDEENNPVKSFTYRESIENADNYCWGNAAFAFGTRLTESFANYRWCPNIIGPKGGGAVEDLHLHQFESMGQMQTKIPTQVLISDRRELELSEAGFIPLTFRKGADSAVFFSANSVQKPKFFGVSKEQKQAETDYKLGTQLPYMFVINRLAHYIKMLQRENIGSFAERADIEEQLNTWIRQYVNDSDGASADARARYPLRSASIEVGDVDGQPGVYKVSLKVRPHFKYMGADFTLSLDGKLE